jgi:ribose transport system permease protein
MTLTDVRAASGPASAPESRTSSRYGGRLAALTSTVEFQLLIGLAGLTGFFVLKYGDQFASMNNMANMTRVAGVLLIVSMGQMFALVVGGFDISVAANMGFSGTVAALTMVSTGSVSQGVIAGVLAGAAVGIVNGILVAALGVSPFVATLGMLTLLTGYANQISGGASISGLPASFSGFGADDWGPLPSTFAIAILVLVPVWLLLARSRAGLYIYSIGGSRETARLAGIRIVRIEIVAYAVCGLLAGIGGVLLASRVGVGQASLGQGYDLLSIATAVIGGVAIGGGKGRLAGVFLGVALITVLTTGMDIAGVGTFIQEMVTGAVVVASVLLARGRGVRLRAVADVLRLRRSKTLAGSASRGTSFSSYADDFTSRSTP